MEIRADFQANGRWSAEIWEEGVLLVKEGPHKTRASCAMREVLNKLAVKHQELPKKQVVMEITKWE